MSEERIVYLVGIGPGKEENLTVEAEHILQNCDCLIGAARVLKGIERCEKPVFQSYLPVEIHQWVKKHPEYQRVAVALSGDTGFYSGAKKLKRELEEYRVVTVPGVSSVVYLAARLNTSWEDACLVSAHGRKQNYIQSIASNRKTFLLLGGHGIGAEVCEKIKQYDLGHVICYIGRNLSYEEEEIIERTGEQLVPEELEGLCTILFRNPFPESWVHRSIPDEAWIRGKVPMTKEEIRTVSLAKLRLTEQAVLYDIGAGTGSVAIEAACQSETIRVYAVEKNPEGIALIEANKRKFRTDWVETVEGTAPEVLEALEPPTHVFIGGSSGNLKEIISCVRKKNPGVRIVINAISLETVREMMEAAEEGLLYEPEIVQLLVAKSRVLGKYHMMTGQNPVYIITDAGADMADAENADSQRRYQV